MSMAEMWSWLSQFRSTAFSLFSEAGYLGLDALFAMGMRVQLASVAAVAGGLLLAARAQQSAANSGALAKMPWFAREAMAFPPLWPALPFSAGFRGTASIFWGMITGSYASPPQGGDPAKDAKPAPTFHVSFGPSYLQAALWIGPAWVVWFLADYVLATALGLPLGQSGTEWLILGKLAGGGAYLPMLPFPNTVVALSAAGWLAVWWLLAVSVRWQHGDVFYVPQPVRTALPAWFGDMGARAGYERDASFTRWALALTAALGTVSSLAQPFVTHPVYRIPPSLMGALYVATLGWAFHLALNGRPPPDEEPEPTVKPNPEPQAGWPELLADLEARGLRDVPVTVAPPRSIPQHDFLVLPAEWLPGRVSPLLAELLPPPAPKDDGQEVGADATAPVGRPNRLQLEVLIRMAKAANLRAPEEVTGGVLTLDSRTADFERKCEPLNDLVVLAPEGAGKTTLALLAAANQVFTRASGALIVVRDAEARDACVGQFRRTVEASSLRWSLHVASAADGAEHAIGERQLPDVVVASLDDVMTRLLPASPAWRRVLSSMQLLIVDDVERISGAAEVHAQLILRRLRLLLSLLRPAGDVRRTKVEERASKRRIATLVLGSEAMHDMPAWVQSLVGELDGPLFLGFNELENRSQTRGRGVESGTSTGAIQQFFAWNTARNHMDIGLDPAILVEAAELLAVPWHYRRVGESGVGVDARSALSLRQMPRLETSDVERAGLILLEGPQTAVAREMERLRRAGALFQRRGAQGEPLETIVPIVTLVSPFEEMAFTSMPEDDRLTAFVRSLPRYTVPPRPDVVAFAHLGAEIAEDEREMERILDTYGSGVFGRLRGLLDAKLILAREERGATPDGRNLLARVYLRATTGAYADRDPVRLPMPPVSVEACTPALATVQDVPSKRSLPSVDRGVVGYLFYPDAVIVRAGGRFLVDHYVGDVSERRTSDDLRVALMPTQEILVSTPRRTVSLEGPPPDEREVRLGLEPLHLQRGWVDVRVAHASTLWVHPGTGEIDAERVPEGAARRLLGREVLSTEMVALRLDDGDPDRGSSLAPDAVTLLGAAMRVALRNVLREGGERSEVVYDPDAPVQRLVLVDLATGGNGAAQLLYQELFGALLRATRLVLERCPYPRALVHLHDTFSIPDGMVARLRAIRALPPGERREQELKFYEDVRSRVLSWLDVRLGAELPGMGATPRWEPRTHQAGEGDVNDWGRVWFTRTDRVDDLIWTKVRFDDDSGEPATVDVGFGRRLVRDADYDRPLPPRAPNPFAAYELGDVVARKETGVGRVAPYRLDLGKLLHDLAVYDAYIDPLVARLTEKLGAEAPTDPAAILQRARVLYQLTRGLAARVPTGNGADVLATLETPQVNPALRVGDGPADATPTAVAVSEKPSKDATDKPQAEVPEVRLEVAKWPPAMFARREGTPYSLVRLYAVLATRLGLQPALFASSEGLFAGVVLQGVPAASKPPEEAATAGAAAAAALAAGAPDDEFGQIAVDGLRDALGESLTWRRWAYDGSAIALPFDELLGARQASLAANGSVIVLLPAPPVPPGVPAGSEDPGTEGAPNIDAAVQAEAASATEPQGWFRRAVAAVKRFFGFGPPPAPPAVSASDAPPVLPAPVSTEPAVVAAASPVVAPAAAEAPATAADLTPPVASADNATSAPTGGFATFMAQADPRPPTPSEDEAWAFQEDDGVLSDEDAALVEEEDPELVLGPEEAPAGVATPAPAIEVATSGDAPVQVIALDDDAAAQEAPSVVAPTVDDAAELPDAPEPASPVSGGEDVGPAVDQEVGDAPADAEDPTQPGDNDGPEQEGPR
jgi:hypothetical protein